MRARLVVSLLFIVLAAGFVWLPTARAEGTGGDTQWGIVPVPDKNPAITANGYFVYPMRPGARVTGKVLLRNRGTKPVTIDLTTVTAQTAQNGGSAFAVESASGKGIAGWVVLSQRQAVLAPGDEQLVPFSVHAPDSVQPGQYLTGIAASEAPAAAAAGSATKAGLGASITMRTRYVIAVQADIAGTWKSSLSIPKVNILDQPSGTVLGVQLRNDGDIFLKPSGRIIVTDAAGKQLISQEIKMGTFVPGTEISYPVRWPGKPTVGTYNVAVDLGYAEGKHAIYKSTFEVSGAVEQHAAERAQAEAAPQTQQAAPPPAAIQPWMIYAVGALLLLIVILLSAILLRGRRGSQNA